jgi:hypothetical protein
MSRSRSAALGAITVTVFTAVAAAAYAGTDHWYASAMAAGVGNASVEAHSITYIQGSANLNGFCVAKDQGITGNAPATRAVAGLRTCATSGGFASRSENSACCYHGWADNQTAATITFNSSTYYDY